MISRITRRDLADCALLHATIFSEQPWAEGMDYDYSLKHIKNLLGVADTTGFKYRQHEKFCGYSIAGIERFANGKLLRLREIAVDHTEQKKGIGKALIIAMENYARQHHCTKIMLSTYRDTPAHAFYSQMGYEDFDGMIAMGKVL